MKHLFIIFSALLHAQFAVAASEPSDSLTVDQAIRQVVQNHPLVQEAIETAQASRAHLAQSESYYYPAGDLELGYARLGPVAELGFPGLGSFKLFPENNYDEHVSLRQTLYDFGKTSASVELSQRSTESADKNIELVKIGLAYQTIQSFYSILFFRRSIRVQDQQIGVLNQHLDLTQKKVQSGTATDFEVLTTQVRIAAAQNKKYELQNELQKQEAVFHRLMGTTTEEDIRLSGDFVPVPVNLNADSLALVALRERLEIKQSLQYVKIAEAREAVVSRRDRPALKLNLEYGIKNGYMPNLDAARGNWLVAIGASVPIFNGFRTRSEEMEATATRRASEARSKDLERYVVLEVNQSVSDVRTNGEKIQTSELQVEQARQALEIAKVRYLSGVITNLDLLDAETALAQAELSHLDALYRYVLSTYALKKAIGEEF